MPGRTDKPRSVRPIFLLTLVLLALVMLSGDVSARRLPNISTGLPGDTLGTPDLPPNDAYLVLVPQGAAPPNGGTATVGDRFVLELWLDAGSDPVGATAQQSYLTFTHQLLQNVNVSSIGTGCIPTSTVTLSTTNGFHAVLQNEVCNGPAPCNFPRGGVTGPGSIAFASGTLQFGRFGYFRVAMIGLCAIAPGQTVLHWQFSPPAPSNRDAEIVNEDGDFIHDPALFADYTINVVAPTSTPTETPTYAPTSTPTPTFDGSYIRDAYLYLLPQSAAPPNGGTATVGDRFVLEMWLNTGSYPKAVTAHQSYLTFTHELLDNVRVSNIATSCVLTGMVTPDFSNFDAVLQNEVCNGPTPCSFPRGGPTGSGSIAFSSGTLAHCPGPTCPVPFFRVAEIGLCAVAPGQALLHWQFSPPALTSRDTEIVILNGALVHNPALFDDYVVNIVTPTDTPTSTPTSTPVPHLVGHVNWQGRPPQPDPLQQIPITLTLKMGATEVNYPAQYTDQYGFFTVTLGSLPIGIYNWRVTDFATALHSPKYLANSGTVECGMHSASSSYSAFRIPHSAFVEMGMMKVGDANHDNRVSISDFNILKLAFGTSLPDPNYDDRADFTGDQVINAADFNLLRSNYGLAGAPPLNP